MACNSAKLTLAVCALSHTPLPDCFVITLEFCFLSVLNVTGLSDKEPVIYHGHTLTTKIAFRDVIHTINVRANFEGGGEGRGRGWGVLTLRSSTVWFSVSSVTYNNFYLPPELRLHLVCLPHRDLHREPLLS